MDTEERLSSYKRACYSSSGRLKEVTIINKYKYPPHHLPRDKPLCLSGEGLPKPHKMCCIQYGAGFLSKPPSLKSCCLKRREGFFFLLFFMPVPGDVFLPTPQLFIFSKLYLQCPLIGLAMTFSKTKFYLFTHSPFLKLNYFS